MTAIDHGCSTDMAFEFQPSVEALRSSHGPTVGLQADFGQQKTGRGC